MNPIEPTPEQQVAYWSDHEDGGGVQAVVIGGPEEGPDVVPCPALVGSRFELLPDGQMAHWSVIHVAWQLDEIEVAHLANGGTLWLTTYGGLPIHRLEVAPR